MNNYIALIDPSVTASTNIGNEIIIKSIRKILAELFPQKELISISPYLPFKKAEKQVINKSQFCFAGGTNMLSSNIRHFPVFTPKKTKGFYFYPSFKNIILFGTGWSRYENYPDWATTIYYKNILHPQIIHSVREDYSKNHLNKAGIKNVLNTCCPTTWALEPNYLKQRSLENKTILFTITDYAKDKSRDNILIESILRTGVEKVWFFPQGAEDLEYLNSLEVYKKNKLSINILQRSFRHLEQFVTTTNFKYIGTRLHCGIFCMQYGQPTCIIGVDNRSIEMAKGSGLPVIERNDQKAIDAWLNNESLFPNLTIPYANIETWKKQFSN